MTILFKEISLLLFLPLPLFLFCVFRNTYPSPIFHTISPFTNFHNFSIFFYSFYPCLHILNPFRPEILFHFLFVMYRLAFSPYLYGLNIHASEKEEEEVIADNHHFSCTSNNATPHHCFIPSRPFFNICVSNSVLAKFSRQKSYKKSSNISIKFYLNFHKHLSQNPYFHPFS